jgi:hypothetical protein
MRVEFDKPRHAQDDAKVANRGHTEGACVCVTLAVDGGHKVSTAGDDVAIA